MSTTKHTPGKLVPFWNPNLIGTEQLVNGKTRVLLKCDNINGEPGEERATVERIIKCWNACEVINPEAVPEMLKVLRLMRDNEYTGADCAEMALGVLAKAEAK